VSTAATEVATARRVPPFAAAAVTSIAVVVAVLHCAASALGRGYWFDEVYMLAIGRYHLDWGSADQPPLAPALAALMDTVAPGSQPALALPAVLATGCAVVLAGLIAREFGCERRAQVVTALAQATVLWTSLAGHWLSPYALEPAQWLLLIWLLIRWVRLRDDRLLIALGCVAGVAALTKFQVILLCSVLVVAVAVVGPRELLRRPMLWFGAGIAAVIASPTIIWQQVHGWPQMKMAPVVAGEAEALYGGRGGIAVQLILFAGVLGVALACYGLWRLLRDDAMREYRFLAVAFAVLYVMFVATAGRPYYLAGMYAPLAAAGALGFAQRRELGKRRRWPVWLAVAISTGLAAGALILSVNITRSDVGEQIAKRTADAYHALPVGHQQRTAVVGESYILAAYLDGYSERFGLPEAHSLSRSYGYFAPPRPELDDMLYVGRDPGSLRVYFDTSRQIADIGEDMHAFILTGRSQSWEYIWSHERTLTVS
jgi:4-amino-4-deoxy-L-arabinose transferase-like glycosyltransferase